MPSLFVLRGNDQGARYELDDPPLGIGRDPSNAIQLHDTEVSRRHAEIRRINSRWSLVDLGSSNGTYVNNRRIQTHLLETGDEVRIGSTVMLFRVAGDEEPDANSSTRVDIVQRSRSEDDSRIVQAISPEESGRIIQSTKDRQSAIRFDAAYKVMYDTTMAVRHTLDIAQLLQQILKIVFEYIEADRGCILLINENNVLEPKASRTNDGSDLKGNIKISGTIVDYVMKKGQAILSSDARDDARWNPAASILKQNIVEAICVPMQGRHNMVGLIYIDTATPPERLLTHGVANKFNEEHLKLMVAIGHQAAMAVEDTRHYVELMQAERLAAIGQTIATLSHHTKNILQGIRGASYMIEMGLSDFDKTVEGMATREPAVESLITSINLIRRGWAMCDKNQKKIHDLVMDMLTFSKDREPDLKPADLNIVAQDVVELMLSRAKDHDVELIWRPTAAMPTLVFDPDGMHRAVLNVVTNAIDACDGRDKGCVIVSTEFAPKENAARVVVEDNGVGIKPDDIDKIFQLFNSGKKGTRGTGLGLSVSHKILREHGGRIVVKSDLGRGSRFAMELPAIRPDDPDLDGDPRRTVSTPG